MVVNEPKDQNIPSHIAFIMDGNRRWAENRGLAKIEGHRAGFERFKEIVQACFDLGVKYVTVYAFSTENWKRTQEEVGGLMSLMAQAIKSEVGAYKDRDIKVNIIGNKSDLPKSLQKEISEIENATVQKSSYVLNVALSYGGKAEIVRAVNLAISQNKEVSIDSIAENLYTSGQPSPELIIRTGGQPRLSNFLLWQTDYSELYFTETLWPDFDKNELAKALDFYGKIKRNFGK